jgi:hypothetical protein
MGVSVFNLIESSKTVTNSNGQATSLIQASYWPISADSEIFVAVRITNSRWVGDLDELPRRRFPEIETILTWIPSRINNSELTGIPWNGECSTHVKRGELLCWWVEPIRSYYDRSYWVSGG